MVRFKSFNHTIFRFSFYNNPVHNVLSRFIKSQASRPITEGVVQLHPMAARHVGRWAVPLIAAVWIELVHAVERWNHRNSENKKFGSRWVETARVTSLWSRTKVEDLLF